MEVAEAYTLISRALDAGHAAHGYLIVGDVRGNAAELTDLILRKLFPNEIGQVESGSHPDVVRLEPQGRSRTIKVERGKEDAGPGMRDGLIEPMSTTAFSGGWKVGVISCADRMQVAAANAFLKSLEEPTPKTMYLLLTDQPDAILPTIVSRTQRVDLRLPPGTLEGTASYDQVSEALAARDVAGLAAILKDLKDEAEDEDVAIVRKQFFRTILQFMRQLLISEKLPRYQALRNLEAVEEAFRQSERSIGDEAVLSYMMDRLVFPKEA